MERLPYGALYLHVPFCAQRCGYCAFATEAARPDDPRLDAYVEGLVHDIRAAAHERLLGRVETLYIGGGTPSFLGPRRLVSLVYALSLSVPLGPDTEFTLEANPESLAPTLVRDLYALGVNRFSLGAQSLVDEELRALGRRHTAADTRRALAAALERTGNVSLDLMCGIPLQDRGSWKASLDEACASGVPHVSVYPLSIEDGTPFARAVAAGRQEGPDEDGQAQMMLDANELLEAAGLARYEVASFARPGLECRHNIAYWTGVPYLGLGRGAAGMREDPRTGERQRLLDGRVVERLDPAQAALEDVMLGMRMCRGVPAGLLQRAVGHNPRLAAAFAEMEGLGLVESDGRRYRPTSRGWLLGNEVYRRIWDAAEDGAVRGPAQQVPEGAPVRAPARRTAGDP
ncbi:MAG: radical SAM family heme chaperone HemW [Coriobacteriales bacterium]|jgi:oxygen-independent coproporphyrinogen-3 oxidase|nr:radical SAM family heme chaperone HemW [Coriobacteriales bacterium]